MHMRGWKARILAASFTKGKCCIGASTLQASEYHSTGSFPPRVWSGKLCLDWAFPGQEFVLAIQCCNCRLSCVICFIAHNSACSITATCGLYDLDTHNLPILRENALY